MIYAISSLRLEKTGDHTDGGEKLQPRAPVPLPESEARPSPSSEPGVGAAIFQNTVLLAMNFGTPRPGEGGSETSG